MSGTLPPGPDPERAGDEPGEPGESSEPFEGRSARPAPRSAYAAAGAGDAALEALREARGRLRFGLRSGLARATEAYDELVARGEEATARRAAAREARRVADGPSGNGQDGDAGEVLQVEGAPERGPGPDEPAGPGEPPTEEPDEQADVRARARAAVQRARRAVAEAEERAARSPAGDAFTDGGPPDAPDSAA